MLIWEAQQGQRFLVVYIPNLYNVLKLSDEEIRVLKNKPILFLSGLFLSGLFLIVPVLLAKLLELNIFSFAMGKVDTWITFWGSYLGAIIGASTVYFVAQLQMKTQQELQIEAIKIENENSTRREMHQFYLTNKLEKIEEMHKLFNELSSLSIKLNNDLLTFAISKEAIDKDRKSKNDNFNPKEKIDQLRGELRENHYEMSSIFVRLIVLSEYIHEGIKNEVLHLQDEFIKIFGEVKECYYSDEIYKKYLRGSGDELFVLNSVNILTRKLSQVSFGDLQKELRHTLRDIDAFIK